MSVETNWESEFRELAALIEEDEGGRWRELPGPASYSGGARTAGGFFQTAIWERQEGRYAPFYLYEHDLRQNVAACRQLQTFTAIAIGAAQALKSYTLGGDWTHTVEAIPDIEAPAALVAACNDVLRRFHDDNDIIGGLDNEVFDSGSGDGESLLALYGDSRGKVKAERVEPEQLTEPANARTLDDYLRVSGETCWTFGVHRVESDLTGRIDHSKPAGYHIVFDDAGNEWDYLPAWPQPNLGEHSFRCLSHYKRNAPKSAARGVSDYWALLLDLEREDKIMDRVSVGVAVQSAIAWIEEHASGASASSATRDGANPSGSALAAYRNRGAGERSKKNLGAGTIVHTSAGKTYKPSPLASSRWELATTITAALLRRIGVRWQMPEYMISGDASNANFASTLMAGTPFVKARTADQANYKRFWVKTDWKVLKIACDAGLFARWVPDFATLKALVEVQIEAPMVENRDPLALTTRMEKLRQNKIVSASDWATAEGLDPKYAEEHEGDAPANPAVVSPLAAAIESVTCLDDVAKLLAE
jgi:hypothetical protein